jgi:hypothetical protein
MSGIQCIYKILNNVNGTEPFKNFFTAKEYHRRNMLYSATVSIHVPSEVRREVTNSFESTHDVGKLTASFSKAVNCPKTEYTGNKRWQ